MYRQCVLHFVTETATRELVTWIEANYAKVGKRLELEHDNKTKETGWIVQAVCSEAISNEKAQEMTRFYKDHRKGTDI
ncbi:MAG: hypothetical protein ACRCYY_18575 [Trueperaceae bacterium]